MLSIATHQKEKESSNITCTTTPKQQTYVGSFFLFILFLFYSGLGDLPYRYKKKAQMRNRKSVNVSVLSAKLRTVLNDATNKGGGVRWRTPNYLSNHFLTVTHRTSVIIFNIYTDVHKIHSKKENFFTSFLNADKSSCTFRAIRDKKGRYLYIHKKTTFSGSICVCSPVVSQRVANQVHPRTCNRQVVGGCGGAAGASFHFSSQTPIMTFWDPSKIKSKILFSFSVSNQRILLINRQTWDKKQKEGVTGGRAI